MKIPLFFFPVRGGLGKEVNEIAEITIFTHLFLPPSRFPPSNLVPQIVLFQRLLLKVSCRCIHSKGLSKSANSFPRRVVRPAGSYRFPVQSLPYSALLGEIMLLQTCPLLRACLSPAGAGQEGLGAQSPPAGGAGVSERGLSPAAALGHRGCSGRCRRGAAAARRGKPCETLSCRLEDPAASPSRPRQSRAPTTTGGSGSGVCSPPVGSGRGFLSPRWRKSSRGCGALGTAGPGLGALPAQPRSPGASLGLQRERHARATRLRAAASPSVRSSPFLCLCLFTCLLLKRRHFSKRSLRVSPLKALAGAGVFRCGTTCGQPVLRRAPELPASCLGTAWVGFSFGHSGALELRVKQRSFCKRHRSNSPPLKRSFCWENKSDCKILFI